MKNTSLVPLIAYLSLLRSVFGHIAPFNPGMYCLNGTSGFDDPSTNEAVNPLFELNFADWWMHAINQCDKFPPPEGDYLELPANGNFTVELAMNRAFTTFSFDGQHAATFADGLDHPGLGKTLPGQIPPCITEPNIHTQNESMAAGTAFAISYQSDITQVTPQNLVVFTVLYNSPWKRLATYSVPQLPACPPDGCICVWGWVPNGCGEPNMYMLPSRCKVTGMTGNAAVAPGIPGVWCEDDPLKCVNGPKQMIYWNQHDGNNIEVDGTDLAGDPRSPAYNMKLGFKNGAQTDIFMDSGSATQTSISSGHTPTSTPSTPSNDSPTLVPNIAWLTITLFLAAIYLW